MGTRCDPPCELGLRETLEELLRDRSDGDRQRLLAVFVQVCQAVAYAHSRGACHGALTPRFVLVGRFGEVQVVGWRGSGSAPGEAEDVAALGRILGRILLGRPVDPDDPAALATCGADPELVEACSRALAPMLACVMLAG